MNLVLSYGDLARAGGYRTRVLGELQALDRQNGLDPFLLVFDRNPAGFENTFGLDVPHRAIHRSSLLQFYPAVAQLATTKSIRLVHAHNLYSAALALSLRWKYGYKVVLDYHGRIPEEYVFLGKGGAMSRVALELLERFCVDRADHVIVVSRKLGEYLDERYKVPQGKISVIPCCADERSFSWDAGRRETIRRSLDLSVKFVCTHLGSFFEWYEPEMVVKVFEQIRSRLDAHLLVVTSDVEKAAAYLSTRLPRETFSVRHATHEEVPGLLNASDLGLLLLRSSPNIKTSSPAKFAEYLNCGLPVLISPDVGDFSAMVADGGVGAIVTRDAHFETSTLDSVVANRAQFAEKCMTVGRSLTWTAVSATWSKIASAK